MPRYAVHAREGRLPSLPVLSDLDPYVSPDLRSVIEETYYAQINERGTLDQLTRDAHFLLDPGQHVGFFADHGVVHVRDVAVRVLDVLHRLHGVLLPPRPRSGLDFMRGYGVLTAYVHDVGMADFSPFGRTVHPEAAAQIVFDPSFDSILERIWAEDSSGVRTRILNVTAAGALDTNPKTVLRELLAMAACHSKRAAPAEILDDPLQLRRAMQAMVATPLHETYAQRTQREDVPAPAYSIPLPNLQRFYGDVGNEPFRWLTAPRREARELVEDVVDVLRVLRCADALRQRGSALRTSGSFQLFVDGDTGNAVCSVESDEVMWFVELADEMASGEANLAACDLDADGNLWLSFHHGLFASPQATERAVTSAARIVEDVQADIVPSLRGRWPERPRNRSGPLICIEHAPDSPEFAGRIRNELSARDPALGPSLRLAPSLAMAAERERARYLDASADELPPEYIDEVVRRSARAGQKVDHLDQLSAFDGVRLATVEAGETVVAAGEPAGFVYIPSGPGLRVEPLGGYPERQLAAWSPVGATAVIRGAWRNGTVVAERPVDVLMIPRDTYLRHWYRTYSVDEFVHRALQGRR